MRVLYLQQWVTESYHPYNIFSSRTQFMSLSIYLLEIKVKSTPPTNKLLKQPENPLSFYV